MPPSNLTVDERDSAPSAEEFLQQYVEPNKPLIIRGGAKTWPAMKWSAAGLAEAFGEEIVTVAPLRSSGPHAHLDKWLEAATLWEHDEPEPDVCDANHLLVVSAMRVKMRVKKFVRLLRDESVAAGFYADGAGNLAHSFPFLRDGFSEPQFAAESPLELKKADLWMGGKSISRMHFDNLDNLFAQVVGRKTFVLARPHEGAKVQGGRRLRKAACRYAHPGEFSREGGGVLHETVLNYLAVPERPDSLPTIAVTLGPGDLLYLPFGWWHEVHSHPDKERGNLSVSISHFYTPFYCRLGGKTCTTLGPLMRNPRYGDSGADDEAAAKAVLAGEKATTAIATSRRSRRWLALAAIATAAAVAAAVLVRRRRA